MTENKKSWVSRIESRGDALKQLRGCSIGFLLVGIWTLIASILANPLGVVDAVIILVATFYMFLYHSRIAISILLIFSVINFAGKFAPLLGFGQKSDFGGLLIPAIVLIMAIRAFEAVFVLNKQFANPASSNNTATDDQ